MDLWRAALDCGSAQIVRCLDLTIFAHDDDWYLELRRDVAWRLAAEKIVLAEHYRFPNEHAPVCVGPLPPVVVAVPAD